mmetsp:Transcript_38432/g.89333  ORF Transcript_38432/g.89333 Transcript_38432/m.89333 type:complete len:288 (-) Transcript_38432:314-1177(-)
MQLRMHEMERDMASKESDISVLKEKIEASNKDFLVLSNLSKELKNFVSNHKPEFASTISRLEDKRTKIIFEIQDAKAKNLNNFHEKKVKELEDLEADIRIQQNSLIERSRSLRIKGKLVEEQSQQICSEIIEECKEYKEKRSLVDACEESKQPYSLAKSFTRSLTGHSRFFPSSVGEEGKMCKEKNGDRSRNDEMEDTNQELCFTRIRSAPNQVKPRVKKTIAQPVSFNYAMKSRPRSYGQEVLRTRSKAIEKKQDAGNLMMKKRSYSIIKKRSAKASPKMTGKINC